MMATPRSLAITDRRLLMPSGVAKPSDRAFLTVLNAWLDRLHVCRLDALQVREKDLDDASLFALTQHIVRHLRSKPNPRPRILVNGRFDIALAAGADGVHLAAAGLPIVCLQRATTNLRHLLVGRSTHAATEIQQAAREGIAYVTFGPLFPTPSKPSWNRPPGPASLRAATADGIPVLALGGIVDREQVQVAHRAGAHGVAAIRGFVERPEALCEEVRRLWPPASRLAEDL